MKIYYGAVYVRKYLTVHLTVFTPTTVWRDILEEVLTYIFDTESLSEHAATIPDIREMVRPYLDKHNIPEAERCDDIYLEHIMECDELRLKVFAYLLEHVETPTELWNYFEENDFVQELNIMETEIDI